MKDVIAEPAKKTGQNSENSRPRLMSGEIPTQNTALARCYRQIGISAVAAAARYQGTPKNPACAPVPTKWQDLFGDAAA
jgi:hypothetical protein